MAVRIGMLGCCPEVQVAARAANNKPEFAKTLRQGGIPNLHKPPPIRPHTACLCIYFNLKYRGTSSNGLYTHQSYLQVGNQPRYQV